MPLYSTIASQNPTTVEAFHDVLQEMRKLLENAKKKSFNFDKMKTLSLRYSCFSLIHTPTSRRQMSFEIPFVLKNSRNVVSIYVCFFLMRYNFISFMKM